MYFGDHLSSRDVLVFQVARQAQRCEEEVVWEKLHVRNFDMLLQTMKLDTVPIVYVDVFLLRNSKVLVVVKPSNV